MEREAELTALGQAVELVADGERGRLMLVTGESGIGKTTLLRWVVKTASSQSGAQTIA